jgi:hypothetical protein
LSKVKTVVVAGVYDFHPIVPFQRYLSIRNIQEKFELNELWPEEAFENEKLQENWGCLESNFERAALLCMTPNVEELEFQSRREEHWRRRGRLDSDMVFLAPILYAARGEPFGKAHTFKHLRYLSIDCQFMWIGDVSVVFKLASLRYLVLEWQDWDVFGMIGNKPNENWHALSNWACEKESSNVEYLEFRNTRTLPSVIALAISSCRVLKSFIHKCELPFDQPWYAEVLNALVRHSGSLSTLEITFHDTQDCRGVHSEPLAEFHQFTMLEHLRVPFRLITGYGGQNNSASPEMPDFFSVLPPNLLTFGTDLLGPCPYQKTTDLFSHLLRNSDAHMPHLRSISLVEHIWHPLSDSELPKQRYMLPMDYGCLEELSTKCAAQFDYTLHHHELESTEAIEDFRNEILTYPNGASLLKHLTCGMVKRWNSLLSREPGVLLPFQGKLWWMTSIDGFQQMSDEELQSKMQEYRKDFSNNRVNH